MKAKRSAIGHISVKEWQEKQEKVIYAFCYKRSYINHSNRIIYRVKLIRKEFVVDQILNHNQQTNQLFKYYKDQLKKFNLDMVTWEQITIEHGQLPTLTQHQFFVHDFNLFSFEYKSVNCFVFHIKSKEVYQMNPMKFFRDSFTLLHVAGELQTFMIGGCNSTK